MDVTLKDLYLFSWSLFQKNIQGFLLAMSPWVFTSAVLNVIHSFFEIESLIVGLTISVLSIAITIGFTLFGFRYFLNADDNKVEITTRKIANYCIAGLYVCIAIWLGLKLFIIPGLIIFALVSVFPLLILNEDYGPIEAVSMSVSLVRDCWVKVIVFVLSLYIAASLLSLSIVYVFKLLGFNDHLQVFLSEVSTSVLGLFMVPCIFVLYEKVKENAAAMRMGEARGFLSGIDTHIDRERD